MNATDKQDQSVAIHSEFRDRNQDAEPAEAERRVMYETKRRILKKLLRRMRSQQQSALEVGTKPVAFAKETLRRHDLGTLVLPMSKRE
jgi:hypothetical protein